jgi:hypothetical protein
MVEVRTVSIGTRVCATLAWMLMLQVSCASSPITVDQAQSPSSEPVLYGYALWGHEPVSGVEFVIAAPTHDPESEIEATRTVTGDDGRFEIPLRLIPTDWEDIALKASPPSAEFRGPNWSKVVPLGNRHGSVQQPVMLLKDRNILQPEDGSAGIGSSPVFEWEPTESAATYSVTVLPSTRGRPSPAIFEESTRVTVLPSPLPLPRNSNFVVIVVAKLDDGTPLSFSSAQFATGSEAGTMRSAEYSIGDVGPAGGWIFYDKGSYSEGWRYLEAAPAAGGEDARAPWIAPEQLQSQPVAGIGTSELIGAGHSNTSLIVAMIEETGETPPGGAFAMSYEYSVSHAGDTFDDWFLPSQEELLMMYSVLQNRAAPIGGFQPGPYWSSSEDRDNGSAGAKIGAKFVNFKTGESCNSVKSNDAIFVRPIRAFDSQTTYFPGDRGPAGGWIFFDRGSAADGGRYLEAAPTDADDGSGSPWILPDALHNVAIGAGSQGVAIGLGRANTVNALAVVMGHIASSRGGAAWLCERYTLTRGGTVFDDWFLPSAMELKMLEENLFAAPQPIGGFSAVPYWSSTEQSDTTAFCVYLGDCTVVRSPKGALRAYRPVRRF